jgi:hypothetical protein
MRRGCGWVEGCFDDSDAGHVLTWAVAGFGSAFASRLHFGCSTYLPHCLIQHCNRSVYVVMGTSATAICSSVQPWVSHGQLMAHSPLHYAAAVSIGFITATSMAS